MCRLGIVSTFFFLFLYDLTVSLFAFDVTTNVSFPRLIRPMCRNSTISLLVQSGHSIRVVDAFNDDDVDDDDNNSHNNRSCGLVTTAAVVEQTDQTYVRAHIYSGQKSSKLNDCTFRWRFILNHKRTTHDQMSSLNFGH